MWIAIVLLLAAVSTYGLWRWLLVRRAGNRPQKAMKTFAQQLVGEPGFQEFMTAKLSARSKAIDAANEAGPPGPAQIIGLIEDLLGSDDLKQAVASIRLEKAGASAELALLKALDDPTCSWDLAGLDGMASTPAVRIARQLLRVPSRQLGPRVTHLVDHSAWRVSGIALEALAVTGRPEYLPLLLPRLSKQESPAERGVDLALQRGWATPEFRTALLTWARESTFDATKPHSAWAVRHFAAHGGPQALRALQSEEVLSLDNNRTVHFVLDALNQHGVKLPESTVRPMLEKSLDPGQPWPWNCAYPFALRALATANPKAALEIAASQLDRQGGSYSGKSIEFIRVFEGLPKSWNIRPPPTMVLSPEESRVVAVLETCDEVYGEVENGGLSQYFFNSSGDRWPDAVEALKEIGHDEAAATLLEAAKILDPAGASTDRQRRLKRYASLREAGEKKLKSMGFGSKKPDLMTLRYMQRHKDLFVRIAKARAAAGMDSK